MADLFIPITFEKHSRFQPFDLPIWLTDVLLSFTSEFAHYFCLKQEKCVSTSLKMCLCKKTMTVTVLILVEIVVETGGLHSN